jgi:hypothetical protein
MHARERIVGIRRRIRRLGAQRRRQQDRTAQHGKEKAHGLGTMRRGIVSAILP